MPSSDDQLPWGYRFGDLVNALIDCGCKMQRVTHSARGKPCRIKFFLRPGGIRYCVDYDVDDCSRPGRVLIKRIALLIPIGSIEFEDSLHQHVRETAQRIHDWAAKRRSN